MLVRKGIGHPLMVGKWVAWEESVSQKLAVDLRVLSREVFVVLAPNTTLLVQRKTGPVVEMDVSGNYRLTPLNMSLVASQATFC